MNSFFKTVRTALFALAAAATLAFTGVAAAQDVQSTCYGCVTTTPAPQSNFTPSLYFSAWQNSNGGSIGQNAGGDGKGVVQTIAENLTKMELIGQLAANTQECPVDCNRTLSTFKIDTSLITGASATNQGVGNSPVSSVVRSQSFGEGSMQLRKVFVNPPASAQ